MLPPFRTMSGSSGSYQSSSSVAASAHLTGVSIFPGQAADQERDDHPNLSGRLNVLLLAGRDVVAEDLSMLADALGRVVDLPRRPGEASAVYVRRLADALADLAGGERSEAERQLNRIIGGIHLDFVTQAFRNPTGPQAARIVALLETAGFKDSNLAVHSVLTSYRQNEGGDLPAGFNIEGTLPASMSLAPSVPVTRQGAPASAPSTKKPVAGAGREGSRAAAGASVAMAGQMPLVAEEFGDGPEFVTLHTETDNISSRTSSEPPLASGRAEPAHSAPKGRVLLWAEESLVKPFIDYTRPPPRPAVQTEVLTALLVLEGLSEIETTRLLSLLPPGLEAEAALTSALSSHAGPEPDMTESPYGLRGRGVAANDDRHRSALAAAEQQLLRNADEAAGLAVDRRIEQAPSQIVQIAAATRAGTDALIAQALQIGQDPRLATGYAAVPYPPVDERDEEQPARSGFRFRSGRDDADEDEAEREERPAGEDGTHEPGLSEDASETADPAFDYYQRMAGWN